MSSRARVAPTRHRSRLVMRCCWLGGALILTSLLGAQWWNQGVRTQAAAPPNDDADRGPDVVCIGHVDGETGVVSLAPTMAGKVVYVAVKEGDEVSAGQVLLQLDDRALQLRLQEARTAERLAVEQAAQAHQLVDLAPYKTAQLQAAVTAAEAKVAAARAQLEHRKKLFEFQSLTQPELDATQQLVKEAEQLVIVEQNRLREWNESDIRARGRLADLEVAAARGRVQQAELALSECRLIAPKAGRILRVHVGVGDHTAPNAPQPAILFQPAGRLIVRAEVEQEFLGRVQLRMRASIHDDARADSHIWQGRVERLSDWIARRRSIVFEPGAMNDVRTLECIIAVDPDAVPLRIGQRVRVMLYAEPSAH